MTVIVGGGIAGLYAALQCPVGQTVEVYEASGRWGGNIATQYYKGYQYEAGAGRFNDHHRLLMELIRRYQLTPVKIQSVKHSCEHPDGAVGKPVVGKWAVRGTAAERQGMTLGTYLERTYSKAYRKEVQEAFGYDAEFDWLNADDALRLFRTDFREGISYYFLKEGLTELVRRMVAELKSRPGVRMYLRRPLEAFEWDAGSRTFRLRFGGKKETAIATALYLALPKAALERVKGAPLEGLRAELTSVQSVPLHRIYGRFGKDSYYPPQRTTTRLPIRQYIPMNADARLAMVSYSDARAAEMWHRLYQKDPEECKRALEQTLTAMFQVCPGAKPVNPIALQWIRSYYWDAGVHVWNAGVASTEVAERLRFPLGRRVPCYIVGEAYSAHQGWIEGALQTVIDTQAKKT